MACLSRTKDRFYHALICSRAVEWPCPFPNTDAIHRSPPLVERRFQRLETFPDRKHCCFLRRPEAIPELLKRKSISARRRRQMLTRDSNCFEGSVSTGQLGSMDLLSMLVLKEDVAFDLKLNRSLLRKRNKAKSKHLIIARGIDSSDFD